jgi:hypothetical protein
MENKLLQEYIKIANSKGIYKNKNYHDGKGSWIFKINKFFLSKNLHPNSFMPDKGLCLCCEINYEVEIREMTFEYGKRQYQLNNGDLWSQIIKDDIFFCSDIFDEINRINSELEQLKKDIYKHPDVVTKEIKYKILNK